MNDHYKKVFEEKKFKRDNNLFYSTRRSCQRVLERQRVHNYLFFFISFKELTFDQLAHFTRTITLNYTLSKALQWEIGRWLFLSIPTSMFFALKNFTHLPCVIYIFKKMQRISGSRKEKKKKQTRSYMVRVPTS